MKCRVGNRQIYGKQNLMHIYKLRKESEAMHVMNSVIITESTWEMAGYHRGESFNVHT